MAWLSGWSYRKEISITGQSGAGTNYQFKHIIGGSAGGDFHLEGHCTNFPQDIEVTDNDGTTLLKFWIEDITADPLKMWVKVADDLGSNQTIYVYYGKSGATTNSSGADTFLQYHGSESSSPYFNGNNIIPPSNVIAEFSYKILTGTGDVLFGLSNTSDNSDDFVGIHHSSNYYRTGTKNEGVWVFGATDTGHSLYTTFHRVTLEISNVFNLYIDSASVTDVNEPINANENMSLYIYDSGTFSCEWSFVRKYNSPEPAFSSAGSEETDGVTEVYLTLSQNLSTSRLGQANAQGPVILSNTLATIDGGGANASAPITVDDLLGLIEVGQTQSDQNIVLTNSLLFTTGADAVAQSTLDISEILSIIQAGTAASSADVALSEILSILQTGLSNSQGNLALSELLSILSASQSTAGASASFVKNLSLSQTTAEITQSYLALAYDLALNTQSVSTAASTLALAINSGISATVAVNITEALPLSQSLDLSTVGGANSQSGLSLNNILSISILAEALASAGISLNMVESVITNGTLVSITVTTPEGRTIVIGVEIRTEIIPNEDRTVKVPAEDRTITI